MLVDVLPEGDEVRAVTSLDRRLFVVRYPSEQQIEVYDTETFAPLTTIVVPHLSDDVRGLASCDTSKCLFAGDFENKSVCRVDLSSDETFSWRTDGKPHGLSTNEAHNVLVTCPNRNAILEYTPRGLLVRKVDLPSDIAWAWHSIQLTNGNYLVCHGLAGSLHRVCSVDPGGRIVASYGTESGSLTGRLRIPSQLAVDKNGYVFVADSDNNRIVVLDPRLECSQDLPADTVTSGIQGPCALYLDESRGRLYVGESADGRILVFDGMV